MQSGGKLGPGSGLPRETRRAERAQAQAQAREGGEGKGWGGRRAEGRGRAGDGGKDWRWGKGLRGAGERGGPVGGALSRAALTPSSQASFSALLDTKLRTPDLYLASAVPHCLLCLP